MIEIESRIIARGNARCVRCGDEVIGSEVTPQLHCIRCKTFVQYPSPSRLVECACPNKKCGVLHMSYVEISWLSKLHGKRPVILCKDCEYTKANKKKEGDK